MYLPCPILSVSFEAFSSRTFNTDLLSPARSASLRSNPLGILSIFIQRHASVRLVRKMLSIAGHEINASSGSRKFCNELKKYESLVLVATAIVGSAQCPVSLSQFTLPVLRIHRSGWRRSNGAGRVVCVSRSPSCSSRLAERSSIASQLFIHPHRSWRGFF
jgi:hypothetical protein